MHPLFSVSEKEIQQLTDIKARELIAGLCMSELRAKGISPAALSWGGDQRAKDGGVDVRVDVNPPCGVSGYIKKDSCVFQVKAEEFSASKIIKEMAPKGVIRPAIKELAERNGAYIIASTRDNHSDSALADRKTAMEACLSQAGLDEKVDFDFYHSRKIADWVQQHPAMVIWLKDACGRPLVGWKPYGPWAYKEHDADAEYLIDDRVRLLIPNTDESIDIPTAIKRLRTDLSKNISLRIVGLSGVGKTRLVQALFDYRLYPDQPALDPNNVIYTDLSDPPSPQPSVMIESLFASGSDCVVVIDNCGPDVHQRLTEIAKRPGSKIRLITVEYDIQDYISESTLCYRLEGSSDEIIKQLLKRRYKYLSQNDLDKIAEFSSGNARVAFALASTTEQSGELARLRDPELFKRLFYQTNDENDELLKCAEVASLLYSFDGEDRSPDSEIGILAELASVTNATFNRSMVLLQERGLVQQRGKWRAILPQAISNRLAANALKVYPAEVLNHRLFNQATERIARSFSHRLGFLHESKKAVEIVSAWLEPDGRIGDLTKLNDLDRTIFSNVAPVSEECTLAALERAAMNPEFTSTDNYNRHHFIRIARSLAYEPQFFNRATKIVECFALQEPAGYNRDPAMDVLKSLFHCCLSGAKAGPSQRSEFIKTRLGSTDEVEQKTGNTLLRASLKAFNFTSVHGFGFGARKRDYGWYPRTQSYVKNWYGTFLHISSEIGQLNTSHGHEVRVIVGNSLRELWVGAKLTTEISTIAKKFKAIDGWPEGWRGVRETIKLNKDSLSDESLAQLSELERELAPTDLKTKIKAMVIANRLYVDDLVLVDGEDDANTSYSEQLRKQTAAVESLGKRVAHSEDLLYELLPDLLRNNSNGMVRGFGFGVGQESTNVDALLKRIRTLVAPASPTSVCLNFVTGLLSGQRKAHPDFVESFLDHAVEDDVWGYWFPQLQLIFELEDISFQRLLKSLELGKSPLWQYQHLRTRRATDPLSIEQISKMIGSISNKPNGIPFATDIFGMVVHCANEKSEEYRRELGQVAISFLRNLDWSKFGSDNGNLDYEMNIILEFALSTPDDDAGKLEVMRTIVTHAWSRRRSFSRERGHFLAPFFKYLPKDTLDSVYVPDEDGTYRTALRIVSGIDSSIRETAIQSVSTDALVEWCKISPSERYVFAAETCRIFEKDSGDTKTLSISDVAVRILSEAEDKANILSIFIDRFIPMSWTGPRSAVFRERLPLFASLNPTGDQDLQMKIDQAKREFAELIAIEEKNEEAEERSRNERFE